MSEIWINYIKIKNYHSFGNEEQLIIFPSKGYNKPISIVGYNNSGKSNLMQSILLAIGQEYVHEKKFELCDIHNLDSNNNIHIGIKCDASAYGYNSHGPQKLGTHVVESKIIDNEILSSVNPSLYGANKYYSIFYINFHKIKEEINTKKTSWGNIRSFLGKHIKKLVEQDPELIKNKSQFINHTRTATQKVIENTSLSAFINQIKANYQTNLRNNSCEVEFELPNFEDIFQQMVFKIGLPQSSKLIQLEHFGDGYISMFIMAVIQAIAETNLNDKCLFLFEEPESFLHENHQEYFYKVVLCGLANKGHQVIYTTHSAKMVDLFNTQSIIRLEFDEVKKQTVVKANKPSAEFALECEDTKNPINLETYNQYIKNIEPNLNKILFSKKVVLVEGPNDLMTYQYIVKKLVAEKIVNRSDLGDHDKYADAYLNFHNIVIIPHHGKTTAHILLELCKHLNIDCFVVADWDITTENLTSETLNSYSSLANMQTSTYYQYANSNNKTQLTNNWKLLNAAVNNQIHFNIPNLEALIGDGKDFGKDSMELWEKLNDTYSFPAALMPDSLKEYLEIDRLDSPESEINPLEQEETPVIFKKDDNLPF